MPLRSSPLSLLATALVLLLPAATWAQADAPTVDKWETFPFDKKTADPAQLNKLNEMQLKFLRGIVFGKHGRVFDEAAIQTWLKERTWYKPNPAYRVDILNPIERENMDRIKTAEHTKHKFIEPGDLKFYRTKRFTSAQLGKHTAVEWQIMLGELEAIHGKRFPEEPWLQKFFEERYWYKPNTAYSPKLLSPIEKANLETMRTTSKKQRGVALVPGDMGLFRDKPLTPELLKGVGLHELRLLRNEVYARHGQKFSTLWIQDHFDAAPWYTPAANAAPGKPVTLTAIEDKNVALILARENELHESLSTKPVTPDLLQGMFIEDVRKLRNEIYARHGMEFKDPQLQGYFSSLSWYKPDPKFSESVLTATERNNAEALLEQEKKLKSSLATSAA
jgi:hypothetical protein